MYVDRIRFNKATCWENCSYKITKSNYCTDNHQFTTGDIGETTKNSRTFKNCMPITYTIGLR